MPGRGLLVALLMASSFYANGATVPPTPATAPSGRDTRGMTVERVRQLVAAFRADPEFAPRRIERHLHWKTDDPDRPTATAPPPWLFGLAQWLADGARWAMWLLGAAAVALLAVFAWRWAKVQSDAVRARASWRPSHVNDLDIRPESLPADVADAARRLLRHGQVREALSLLYRGTLSNLVHVRGLAIRAASTEGECLRLAQRHLPPADAAYADRLVQAWQAEVYADRRQPAETLAGLCADFDAHVGGALPAGRVEGTSA